VIASLTTSARPTRRRLRARRQRRRAHEPHLREHTAIAEAISARDADAAGAAMEQHMKSAGERLLSSLGDA
jgi:DNA-binding FadR family transcriptional regulator